MPTNWLKAQCSVKIYQSDRMEPFIVSVIQQMEIKMHLKNTYKNICLANWHIFMDWLKQAQLGDLFLHDKCRIGGSIDWTYISDK